MTAPARFSIRRAALSEQPLVRALLQPCFVELSRFPDDHPDPQDENGLYLYPYLDAYWREATRFPYLLLDGEKIAGFALVRHTGFEWEMAEFYVKPAFRRRGLGLTCATLIMEQHPGVWHIGFNRANVAGRRLWTKLPGEAAHGIVRAGQVDGSHDSVTLNVAGNNIED
jgi:predicted acetyltransferase